MSVPTLGMRAALADLDHVLSPPSRLARALLALNVLTLFTFAALATGHLLGGPEEDDRTLLAFAAVSRHPGIAIVVATMTN